MRTEGGSGRWQIFQLSLRLWPSRFIWYLNLQFSFKTQISFSGLYGPKTRQFFNKEGRRTECLSVFPYHAHLFRWIFLFTHPHVNIQYWRNDNPPASSGDTEPIRCVSPNHARVFGASIYWRSDKRDVPLFGACSLFVKKSPSFRPIQTGKGNLLL